jgi:integrase
MTTFRRVFLAQEQQLVASDRVKFGIKDRRYREIGFQWRITRMKTRAATDQDHRWDDLPIDDEFVFIGDYQATRNGREFGACPPWAYDRTLEAATARALQTVEHWRQRYAKIYRTGRNETRGSRLRRGHIPPNTFAAVIKAFLASDKFGRLSESTRYGYRRALALAEHAIGTLDVDMLDPYTTRSFLDTLADRPGIQHVARVSIGSLEKWAIVRWLLPRAVTTGVEVVKSDGAREPWTESEVLLAEAHARPDLARVVTLGATTGQRAGDLCAMKWSAFRTYQGRAGIDVIQQKTKRALWIPLPAELERAMSTWPKLSPFILTSHKGAPWSRTTLTTEWRRERVRNRALAPLNDRALSLHGLRATAVVRLRRAGASGLLIGDAIGMSPQTVQRYSRRAAQADNALAALDLIERQAAEIVQFHNNRS